MKAKAKKDFDITRYGKTISVEKGQLLNVVLDERRSDESGEIQLDGEYLCDNHSPFAKEHFYLLDELELVELPDTTPGEESDAERLIRLQQQGTTNLPYDDVMWLLKQAEKAQYREEWLNKIAEIDRDAFTLVDAQYWALLGLGKV